MSTVWDFTVTRTDWRDGCTTKSINTRKLPKTLAESKKESYEKNRKRMSERTKRKRERKMGLTMLLFFLWVSMTMLFGANLFLKASMEE